MFADNPDRHFFLTLLGMVASRLSWRCQGYCLLPNHYHLVIETPNADLSAGMRELNGEYAQWFNRRHSVDGHLFQGRFHSVLVESQWHLVELVRYLALNPVRAGLCADPMDWPWASFPFLAGGRAGPRFLDKQSVLSLFGRDPVRAREALRAFALDAPRFSPRPL